MAEITEKKTAVKKKEPKTFEEALERLNEIVAALEDGSAPLDASLAYYEEGVSLVRFCNEKLDHAEKQIKILTKASDGSVIEKDFTPESAVSFPYDNTIKKE